jgi:putative ABC transport system permease protein
MLRLAVKNLWAYKKRLLTSALSVVLGISFLCGSFVFTDTLKGLFADLFSSSVKGVDVQVRQERAFGDDADGGPYADGRSPVPVSLLETVRKVPGVLAAEPNIQGYAQALNKKGKLLKTGGAPNFGYVWINDPVLSAYKLFSGKAPVKDDEIAIDRGLAKTGKFKLGDKVKVNTSTGIRTFKLVGEVTFGSSDSALGASAIFFDQKIAQEVLLKPGFAQSFLVRGEKGIDQAALAKDVSASLNGATFDGLTKIEVITGEKLQSEQLSFVNLIFGFINTFFTAFAVVALFVSIFVISNSFSIVVAQRTKEMAMLRTLGASRSQILGSTFAEALAVGVLASIVGVGAGMGVALLIRQLLETFGGGGLPSSGLVLKPRTVILGLVVGTLVTVLAAIAPAIKSSRVKPLAALRDTSIDRADASRGRLIAGLTLLAVSLVFLVLGLNGAEFGAFDGPLNIGVSAGAALIAVVFLGPILAKPLAGALGRPWFGWVIVVFGAIVALAALPLVGLGLKAASDRSSTQLLRGLVTGVVGGAVIFGLWVLWAKRKDRRIAKADEKVLANEWKITLITVALYALSVVSPLLAAAGLCIVCGRYLILTGRSAGTTSGRIARENTIRNPTRTSATALALTIGTALVSAILVLSQSLTQTFRGAVDNAVRGDYVVASAAVDTGFPQSVKKELEAVPGITAVSSRREERIRFGFPPRERNIGGIDPGNFDKLVNVGRLDGSLADLAQLNTVAVAAKTAEDQGLKIGDSINPVFQNGQRTELKIIATYENAEGLGNLYYLTSAETLNTYVPETTIDFLYVKTDGKDNKKIEAAADKALAPYPAAEFQTKKKYADAQVAQFQQFLAIVNALLLLAIIIAILGIANTLRLSIFERTREIGLLRAVGMSRDQIRAAIRWEAIVVATFGAVLGVVLGTGFGTALVKVLGNDGTLKLTVPVPFLIPLTLLASLVGLYAARKPAKDAAGLNILRAIATE